jgi:hypothetical protein
LEHSVFCCETLSNHLIFGEDDNEEAHKWGNGANKKTKNAARPSKSFKFHCVSAQVVHNSNVLRRSYPRHLSHRGIFFSAHPKHRGNSRALKLFITSRKFCRSLEWVLQSAGKLPQLFYQMLCNNLVSYLTSAVINGLSSSSCPISISLNKLLVVELSISVSRTRSLWYYTDRLHSTCINWNIELNCDLFRTSFFSWEGRRREKNK